MWTRFIDVDAINRVPTIVTHAIASSPVRKRTTTLYFMFPVPADPSSWRRYLKPSSVAKGWGTSHLHTAMLEAVWLTDRQVPYLRQQVSDSAPGAHSLSDRIIAPHPRKCIQSTSEPRRDVARSCSQWRRKGLQSMHPKVSRPANLVYP